jgi:hypothetical protein
VIDRKLPLPLSHWALIVFALCFVAYLIYIQPVYLVVILVLLATNAIWRFVNRRLRELDSLGDNQVRHEIL